MYVELLQVLKCPSCGGELKLGQVTNKENDEIIGGSIGCLCGLQFQIIDGVLDFNSKEQEFANNWTEDYKKMNYEELDSKIANGTPDNMKDLNNAAREYIVKHLNENKPQVILDIASGRGMLATYIAENIDYKPKLILSDLSFPVLKYDRLKMKKLNPILKVNYVACDCTKLPFKDSSINECVSFYGIANMMDIALEGIKETNRVLTENGILLNSQIAVDTNTEVAKKLIKELEEYFKVSSLKNLVSVEGFNQLHVEGGFDNCNIITIGESIAEKCDYDAIPIEGEWFAIIIANCNK